MTTTMSKKTPLYELHKTLGGKMVSFAGYSMPLQYTAGILSEHLHTRKAASLFDVSHMGLLKITGERAGTALEALLPSDIIDLPIGHQRYTFFTNTQGGLIDDCIVSKLSDGYLMVINASRKNEDLAHLKAHLTHCNLEVINNRALLALQGPQAEKVLKRYFPEIETMKFMDIVESCLYQQTIWISRAGYTGEDGFEISLPANLATEFAQQLINEVEVQVAGLGARDSLRLEAGLCLYGNDIDMTTTPSSAGLNWAISAIRREGGKRGGGFVGADIVLLEVAAKTHKTKRTGFLVEGRQPVRTGAILVDERDNPVGHITSGGFSPILNQPIAMGYLNTELSDKGLPLFAIVRNKKIAVLTTQLPFIKPGYRR